MPKGRFEVDQKYVDEIENKILPHTFSIVRSYYLSLRAEGKSIRTIQQYIKIIVEYISFMNEIRPDFYKRTTPDQINQFILSKFTKTVNGEIQQTSSVHRARMWYGLDSFFGFLVARQLINNTPVLKEFRPKQIAKKNIKYLNKEEITIMQRHIMSVEDKFYSDRDLAFFTLAISTGLRASALVQINIEDIDFDNLKIRCIEKGQKEVEVLINDVAETALWDWLYTKMTYETPQYLRHTKYAPTEPEMEGPLFITKKGERMGSPAASRMIREYGKAALGKEISAHVLRHTCATLLYEATGDIYLCAQQLNHSNINTTQIYATISENRKKEASDILNKVFK